MAAAVHFLIVYSAVVWSLIFVYGQGVHNQVNGRSRNREFNKCGDLVCICTFKKAICGGLPSNRISFIPILPAEIEILTFDHNCLPHVNVSTFKIISDITLLALSLLNNNIVQIERESFQFLHSLENIVLSENPRIEARALAVAFSSLSKSPINSITMRRMDWEDIPVNMFYYLNSSELKTIDLAHNKMRHINFISFSNLKYLSFLNLNANHIKIVEMSLLKSLERLYLSKNLLSKIPNFCDPKFHKSLVPKLIALYLNGNDFKELKEGSFKCLSKLKVLTLNENSKISLLGNNFILPLYSLFRLELSHIGAGVIDKFAFNSSTIETLCFENNYLNIYIFINITLVFMNSPRLETLSLSNTKSDLSEHETILLLSPLQQLKRLYLRNTTVDAIPVIISKMTSLEVLDLGNNNIRSWNGTIFGRNSKMASLSLNNNMIFAINETSFPSLLLKSLGKKSLDLRNNPYSCTCQNVKSVNWFHGKANILRGYPDSYQSFLPPEFKGVFLKNYNPSEESCAEKNIALMVSVPVSLISIATLLVIALVYKCRWRLRYGLYVFRSRYKDYERIENSDNFVYTGFVIYSDDDRSWVHNELLHRVEDEEGFRLCIRLRDFDVGKVHVDNIVDNMLISEKIIVVLSNNFAKDDWCHFQLLLAETKLLKQNIDAFMLLMLEEISSHCLRASLYKLVTDGQYALWSDNETGNNLFWEQAISQMKKPSAVN